MLVQAPDLNACTVPSHCIRPVGLSFDKYGRLFVSSDSTGEVRNKGKLRKDFFQITNTPSVLFRRRSSTSVELESVEVSLGASSVGSIKALFSIFSCFIICTPTLSRINPHFPIELILSERLHLCLACGTFEASRAFASVVRRGQKAANKKPLSVHSQVGCT